MWPFDEIEDAKKLVTTDLEQNYGSEIERNREVTKQAFIKSFKKHWAIMESLKGRPDFEVNEILRKLGEEQNIVLRLQHCLMAGLGKDPICFGMSFAVLIGILKFAPKYVLIVSGYVIASIKALENKPLYYEYVRYRLVKWCEIMEPQLEMITAQEKASYKAIEKII